MHLWFLPRRLHRQMVSFQNRNRNEDKVSDHPFSVFSLAGMIHKIGLIPACNHQQVPFAYKMYKQDDAFGWKQSNAFKKAFSVDVDIEFLGVWYALHFMFRNGV